MNYLHEDLSEQKIINLEKTQIEEGAAERKKHRYSVCKSCENFIHLTKQCKECFCFMPMKTMFKVATCPKGKW